VGAARRLQHRGRVGGWHVKVTDVLASGAELVGNAELGGGAQRVGWVAARVVLVQRASGGHGSGGVEDGWTV
jgi:hypothetical protein